MTKVFRQIIQGFAAVGLRSESFEMIVIPELGAKIVSAVSLLSGREWLWQPPGGLKLFRNRHGDPFQNSTLVGIDECLPSVAPCGLVPDHGDVWSVAWQLDESALQDQRIRTSVRLNASPLEFERTIDLTGDSATLHYRLTNTSDQPRPYLWAFHPLLRIEEGDRIELPASLPQVLIESSTFPELHRGDRWNWLAPQASVRLDRIDLGSTNAFVKCFAADLQFGHAAIQNDLTGDRLSIDFDLGELPALGIWITRGGWNGYHHVALEPTTTPGDSLAEAAAERTCRRLPPQSNVSWSIRLSAPIAGAGRPSAALPR